MLGDFLPGTGSSGAVTFDDSGELAVELIGGFSGYAQGRYVSGGDGVEGLVILTPHGRNGKREKAGNDD